MRKAMFALVLLLAAGCDDIAGHFSDTISPSHITRGRLDRAPIIAERKSPWGISLLAMEFFVSHGQYI